MDKNNIIGFLLLAILLAGMSITSRQKQQKLKAEELANQEEVVTIDENNSVNEPDVVAIDESVAETPTENTIVETNNSTQAEETVVLENEQLELTFSNKGGRIIKAVLKEYESYESHIKEADGGPVEHVVLYDEEHSTFNWTANGQQTENTYFDISKTANGVEFRNGDHVLSYQFTADNPYLLDYNVKFGSENEADLDWQTTFILQEKDMRSDREFTFLAYKTGEGKFKKWNKRKESVSNFIDEPLSFIVQRQRFFNQTLLSDDASLTKTTISSSFNPDDKVNIKLLETETTVNLKNGGADFQLLISPNDRDILKSVDKSLENIQPKGIFGLTKALAWLFDFFRPYFSNYGLLILVMTLLIKLLLTPLTYRSYLSQAKMSVLKPEIAELNEKHKDDASKKSQEQMKLYSKAGVNPLGGCIPSLLQIPIFFSLYYFFRSSIYFRQKEFLWAEDLSSYDSIFNLPFELPIYGSHVSLFAILYGIALFFSMKTTTSFGGGFGGGLPSTPSSGKGKDDGMAGMMQTQMKFMQYAMPVFLPVIFNAFPAALTFYYFCYNIINALQTLVIKKVVIDEDKILEKIQENKKKPKKTSGFRKRLEDAMKAQQEMQKKK